MPLPTLIARVWMLLIVAGSWQSAHGQIPSRLLRWIPADANAVAAVDVNALMHAPLALREDWRHQAADRFANHEISVPPEARRAVMATQLDLGGTLRAQWEVGILELERTPSFALMARRDGGQLDSIGGHSAVRLSAGRTAVELEPGLVLTTPQANRQTIARWVNAVQKDSAPKLTGYLKESLEHADRKAHIVLAVDLSDSVTAPPVRDMLAAFEPLKGKTADQADIADILASVRGITLTVVVTDKREGAVRVDFGKQATLLKPVAKPLADEILGSLQISLADFDPWTADVAGSTLQLKGEFSQEDLRRVASLFASSPANREVREPDATAATPASSEAVTADVSRKYFRSVKSVLDDLKKNLNKTRDNHAVWMERYARKIDDLPIRSVDPDLLTFGGNVSSSLRYQAQAVRMGALRMGVREAQPVYQTYSYGSGMVGPFGSYGGYSNSVAVRVSPDRGLIRTEEHANAAQVRISETKKIEDGMVQIRRAMTERYNVEF